LVVGGEVSNFFSREGYVVSVETQSGTLNCTETHKHLAIRKTSLKSGNNQWFNPSEEDIEELQTKDLGDGDYRLVPESVPHGTRNDGTPDQLAFVALILADGHIEKSRVKVMLRKDINDIKRIFYNGLKAFGFEDSFKESVNSRG